MEPKSATKKTSAALNDSRVSYGSRYSRKSRVSNMSGSKRSLNVRPPRAIHLSSGLSASADSQSRFKLHPVKIGSSPARPGSLKKRRVAQDEPKRLNRKLLSKFDQQQGNFTGKDFSLHDSE